jgi:hypothetical protein
MATLIDRVNASEELAVIPVRSAELRGGAEFMPALANAAAMAAAVAFSQGAVEGFVACMVGHKPV